MGNQRPRGETLSNKKFKRIVVVVLERNKLTKKWIKQENSNKKEQNYINLNATALYLIREILVLKRDRATPRGRKKWRANFTPTKKKQTTEQNEKKKQQQ